MSRRDERAIAAYRRGWTAEVTAAGALHMLTTRLVVGKEYRDESLARLEAMGRAEAKAVLAQRLPEMAS